MSGSAAQTIPDDDDDDIPLRGNGGGGQQEAANSNGQRDDDLPYEIIETDDNFKPLNGAQGREEALDERSEGEGTYLDRVRAGQDYADERRNMSPEQRSRSRRSSRQRQREARDRNMAYSAALENQVRQLTDVVGRLMPRMDAADRARMADEVNGLAGAIESQEAIAAGARAAMVAAMQDGDHQAMADAMDRRDAAIREAARLSGQREQAQARIAAAEAAGGGNDDGQRRQNGGGQRQQPNGAARMSPEAERRTSDFFQRHSWINRGNPQDPETREVLALDALVTSRGLRAEQPEYWEAIEEEMRNSPVLGHRFDDDDPAPQRGAREQNGSRQQPAPARRGPMVGGGAERQGSQRNGAREQVYLSPGRKQTMIDAGIMNRDGTVADPAKFARTLKYYKQFDAENPRS